MVSWAYPRGRGGTLAAVFHWPPSELLDLDADELLAWHAQARRWR